MIAWYILGTWCGGGGGGGSGLVLASRGGGILKKNQAKSRLELVVR
jgi:hypothetical protein